MQTGQIEQTKQVLAHDMKRYVEIILQEYGDAISEDRQEFLRKITDFVSKIKVKNTGTISMFATKEEIVMPEGAYKVFKYMKMLPVYGINKRHQSYKEGEIINSNTYYDYIKHAIISGMSVEEFFRDSLLHETMHFCGSGGGDALREGFTELKTRELAQKYGLRASRCGYPKEVEIASRLQEIIGGNVANQLTFAQNNREIYRILQDNCGVSIAELYFEISDLMNRELYAKYNHSKFGGIFGPIKKASAYSKIDYSKIQERLEEAKMEFEIKKKQRDFEDRVKGQELGVEKPEGEKRVTREETRINHYQGNR